MRYLNMIVHSFIKMQVHATAFLGDKIDVKVRIEPLLYSF